MNNNLYHLYVVSSVVAIISCSLYVFKGINLESLNNIIYGLEDFNRKKSHVKYKRRKVGTNNGDQQNRQ